MQSEPKNNQLAWARRWLIAAGIYNLVWGGFVIVAPGAMFGWFGMAPMVYPEIWQCVGMIVGVYGVGYLIAARDHRRHWPIVLVGLLGKILGPIGFAVALWRGVFPPEFALTIVTNDLIWWVPFAMILWDAARSAGEAPERPAVPLDEALQIVRDDSGEPLRALTDRGPTLVVLLRHAGCTFCKETLADLSAKAATIRGRGYRIAVVTMSGHERNGVLREQYQIGESWWFSDPDRLLYSALELQRGTFWELFGPHVFLGGVRAALRGHGVGKLEGDGFQMPGAFVLSGDRVLRSFRNKSAASRTDFESLACEAPA